MADGLVITGPTASGKTALSIAVARLLGGELISMDSRQVYRGMDIGTAKPTASQLAAVPHFGVDIMTPRQRYSAGGFARDARVWISEIRARGHVPILVGGTGFFLRSLTHPMFAEPALDPVRKEGLKRYLRTFARAELLRWLDALDPESCQRLALQGGRQRLARAIEVVLLTGRTLPGWQRGHPSGSPPLRFLTFVLDLPRAVLYDRINRRVDAMLAAGLVEEVRMLVRLGYDDRSPGMNATGYIELLPYLRGETTLAAAADQIRSATRRYARRQLTWFRHQLGPEAIRLDASLPVERLAAQVADAWSTSEVNSENRH